MIGGVFVGLDIHAKVNDSLAHALKKLIELQTNAFRQKDAVFVELPEKLGKLVHCCSVLLLLWGFACPFNYRDKALCRPLSLDQKRIQACDDLSAALVQFREANLVFVGNDLKFVFESLRRL